MSDGRVLISHASFETERPGEAQAERDYENHRRAVHLRKHGTLDGYQSPREFPCTGMLRCTDEDGPITTLACDACEFVTSMRTESREHDEPAAW
jgi:hypothetical protein